MVTACLMLAHDEFEASARAAIYDAGKGLNVESVPLRFNHKDLTLKSHFDEQDGVLHVEVRGASGTDDSNA